MPTICFNVPDEIKKAFDAAFSGQKKSAVIAKLMIRAVEEQALRARRMELYGRLTALRGKRPRVTSAQLTNARHPGRP